MSDFQYDIGDGLDDVNLTPQNKLTSLWEKKINKNLALQNNQE